MPSFACRRAVTCPTLCRADAEVLLDGKTARNNPDTYGMASFVAALRYEDIPGEVIERIKEATSKASIEINEMSCW